MASAKGDRVVEVDGIGISGQAAEGSNVAKKNRDTEETGGVAVADKPKKTRRKFPHVLMEELAVGSGQVPSEFPSALRRVDDAPPFDDFDGALAWAQKNKTGTFHVVVDKGAFKIEVEQVERKKVTAVTT